MSLDSLFFGASSHENYFGGSLVLWGGTQVPPYSQLLSSLFLLTLVSPAVGKERPTCVRCSLRIACLEPSRIIIVTA